MSSLVRYVIGSCISSVIAPAVKATACARAASITIDESSGAIRYLQHETRGYEEFPVADELQSFDASDRKFVAAAVAAGPDAEIVVALDRG